MHNIIYDIYSGKTTEDKILKDVLYTVQHSGDRYGTDSISFKGHRVFECYEEARAYIESLDNRWYEGYAVKFYDYSKVEDTAKIKVLRDKIIETKNNKREYIAEHSVKSFKAAYIGCAKCGSKLSREHLNNDKCPLCHNDLRSESTLQRINSFDKRIEEYNKKIHQEQQKQKKKAEIEWLVKYEYHS